MPASFVPNHYPRFAARGRMLTDAQQHQYDILRTAGGKIIYVKGTWWYEPSDSHTVRIRGLNQVAMFKLVSLSLVECLDHLPSGDLLFVLSPLAKDIPGPRYKREGHMLQKVEIQS